MIWKCTKCKWMGEHPVVIRVGLKPACPECLSVVVFEETQRHANDDGRKTD